MTFGSPLTPLPWVSWRPDLVHVHQIARPRSRYGTQRGLVPFAMAFLVPERTVMLFGPFPNRETGALPRGLTPDADFDTFKMPASH